VYPITSQTIINARPKHPVLAKEKMRLPLQRQAATAAFLLLVSSAMADVPHWTDAESYNAGALGDAPNQTFRSNPGIMAPIFQVTKLDVSQLDSAPYLFLDWHYDHAGVPMIFRADDLSLVYADQWYPHVKNTRVQELGGERFLTFWEGAGFWGYGRGGCLFFDEGYNLRYNITPIGDQFELLTDLHECQVTEEGTVLITIYDPIPFDLSPIGGPVDGTLLDGVFQEIDPKTGKLVFEWRASDHYSITDSPETVEDNMREHGFDFYHMNSVAKVSLASHHPCL
jgi:hypothetical protein